MRAPLAVALSRGLCAPLVVVLFFGMATPAPATPAAEAVESLRAAEAALERGAFEQAAQSSRDAERQFARARDRDGQIEAMLREVAACRALGRTKLAGEIVERAQEVAAKAGDGTRHAARLKAAWGAVQIFGSRANDPEMALREALALARDAKDEALTAQVLNDLGVLLEGRAEHREARAMFEQSAALARTVGDRALAARARRNLAGAALLARDFTAAEKDARTAVAAADEMPASHERAFLLMGCAQVLQKVFVEAPEHKNALRADAFRWHRAAQKIAEELGDPAALSYALGYQGALYEFEKRPDEALALTRQAIFHAQRAQAPDALYRWQWQAGRLLAARGARDEAVSAYRRGAATLQTIRNDVAARFGNRNAGSSFREVAGGLYFELADLLLQQADVRKDAAEIQTLLREARDTAELLKAAELEDYFQDDCVNLLRTKTKKVEALSRTAAVIYLVPLPARTELLVSLPTGRLERFKAGVGAEELTETVRRFRLAIEDRTTDAYLEPAQQLYAWLIKPLEAMMAKGGLDTMVFVPDGALRTIPLAALYDGQKFLIEKYAVAVTPGLELMEATPVAAGPSRLLISGLSDAVGGFPALQNVPREIEEVSRHYAQREVQMNETFRHRAVEQKLTGEAFTIVHLASHGQITSDVRESFVLTYDRRLTLDDLERFIRPGQLRDQPIELLTLSACQTAAGDDRAALGLAGVAVKAGARSAFATLWCVNDLASARLVADFYATLSAKSHLSKAQALQSAQKKLLAEPRYGHPCYWSPYLIIGNWL